MDCNIASMAAPQFPAGLRVLVVDDDPICLKVLEKMLSRCLYQVTTCSRAVVALSMLRERKGAFDLVLSDVYMPDMDGFKLLELVGLEMDLPVIMMSADDGNDVVMKGVTHGACDYLIKPVRIEALRNIWQHVVRKKRNGARDLENSGSVEEGDRQKRTVDDGEIASSVNEGSWKNMKRRKEGKEEDDEVEDHDDSSTLKKARVVWSVELHQQFVNAVNQLGVEKAVPKKILELMNVPGLTRENVASHLQKYRLYLRRVSVPHYQGRFDTPLTGSIDGIFGSSSSLDGFDLQAFAVSGQLPTQSLISMHGGSRRVANNSTCISAADQISFFNSDANCSNPPRIRSAPGQPLNNKQINLLCGTSANIESTQLGQSQPALQSYGSMGLQVTEGTSGFTNLSSSLRTSSSYPGGTNIEHLGNSFAMQMSHQGQQFPLSQKTNNIPIDILCQTQWRGQLLNETKGGQNSIFLPPTGQQILPSDISGRVLAKGITTNGHTSTNGAYTNASSYGAVPQTQFAEFENSSITESTGSCFPLASCIGASSHSQVGMLQETQQATRNVEAISNWTSLKGARGYITNNDLGQLRQIKGQDCRLQNINLPYESAQQFGSNQNHFGFGPSNSVHRDLNTNLKDGGRNTCSVTKDIISVSPDFERAGGCIGRQNSVHLVENYAKVKAEMPDPSLGDVLFTDNIFPNELMTVIGRQPQGGAGQDEPEFNFDGFPFDDISV